MITLNVTRVHLGHFQVTVFAAVIL